MRTAKIGPDLRLHRTTQTNAGDIRDAQKLAQNVFPPWRPTMTSRSLQSIARPFQKRFRQAFGNARILNFYLSIKAWEEKSLPKSYLGWFFLEFGEGKVAKENISIFWFIWPLNTSFPPKLPSKGKMKSAAGESELIKVTKSTLLPFFTYFAFK